MVLTFFVGLDSFWADLFKDNITLSFVDNLNIPA
jgi:hypothetical protein